MSVQLLGQLIDEHSAALVLLARSLCDCPEDVVQEAFIRFSTQHPPPENHKAWLFRVVRNGALTAARSRRRRRAHESAAGAGADEWFVPNAADAIDASAAVKAIEHLPPELREVIILRLWADLTFKDIGQLTQTSDSTAQRRYEAALAALRERLETLWPTPLKTKAN